MPYWIGALGATLFVVVFLLDGMTRPGYSPTRHTVSALALGPRGWLQQANFVLCGAAVTASAVGLLVSGDHRMLGLVLTIFGLGLVVSVVPMDPMRGYPPGTPDTTPTTYSLRHQLHDWAGAAVFGSVPVAAVAGAVAVDGPLMTVYSAATALVTAVLFVVFGSAWEADHPRAGLIQRVTIVAGWGWLGVLCWSLLP